MARSGDFEPTWDDMMEDTERAVKALDGIFDRCRRAAEAIRNGGGNLGDLERLLNQSAPATEADRRLAFMMAYFAHVKRGALIEYLFKIRRACLLLLVDGRAAATALMVENILEIDMDAQGRFHIARCDAVGPRGREAPCEAPRASDQTRGSHIRQTEDTAAGERSRSRRRGGRRRRGRKGGDSGADAAPLASGPARAGRAVMSVAKCQQVLADLDAVMATPPPARAIPASERSAGPTSAEPRDTPYLTALVQGVASRRTRPSPLTQAEPATAAAEPAEPAAAAAEPAAAVAASAATMTTPAATAGEPATTAAKPTTVPAAVVAAAAEPAAMVAAAAEPAAVVAAAAEPAAVVAAAAEPAAVVAAAAEPAATAAEAAESAAVVAAAAEPAATAAEAAVPPPKFPWSGSWADDVDDLGPLPVAMTVPIQAAPGTVADPAARLAAANPRVCARQPPARPSPAQDGHAREKGARSGRRANGAGGGR